MKTKTKKFQAPLTKKNWQKATDAVDAIRTAGDDSEQLFNAITFEQSTDDLKVLPLKYRKAIHKAESAAAEAAFVVRDACKDAENWLSDNMDYERGQ